MRVTRGLCEGRVISCGSGKWENEKKKRRKKGNAAEDAADGGKQWQDMASKDRLGHA